MSLNNRKTLLLAVALFTSCNPVRGCAESDFDLMADSRLPKWFAVPAGLSRNDLTVKLSYYTPPVTTDDAVLTLFDRVGHRIGEVSGKMCWHPRIDKLKRNEWGGFDKGVEHPRYVIIRVGEVIEVVDHPAPGSWFRVTDDAEIVKEALDSLKLGECRKK